MNKKSNNTPIRRTYKFAYWRNFKYFRIKAKLTQRKAAEKIGVLESMVCNYENNRTEPPLAVVIKMTEVYKASLDELINSDAFGHFYNVYLSELKKVDPNAYKETTVEKFYKDLDSPIVTFFDVFSKEAASEKIAREKKKVKKG